MNRTVSSLRLALPFGCILVLVACSKTRTEEATQPTQPSGGPSGAPNAAVSSSLLTLTSPAFSEGAAVPARFTCEGEDMSPPLSWSDPPADTKSLAVVVEDPDAPRKTFVHWIVYDLPPSTRALIEGTNRAAAALPSARDGENDFGGVGYRGPCPPSGQHRYVFKVYALDVVLPDLNKPRAAALERAMNGHVLAQGRLIGVYQKGRSPRT